MRIPAPTFLRSSLLALGLVTLPVAGQDATGKDYDKIERIR